MTSPTPLTDSPILTASRRVARLYRALRRWIIETVNWGVVPESDGDTSRASDELRSWSTPEFTYLPTNDRASHRMASRAVAHTGSQTNLMAWATSATVGAPGRG